MIIKIPYKPRDYQKEVFDARKAGKKRFLLIFHRRAGKDLTSVAFLIREAIKTVGIYYYVFPTYSQGRKILWDNRDMMKLIPKEAIENKNDTEMKIKLENGSLIQIIGSDRYDTMRGTNPTGIVMSEYAFQHPLAWETLRPILAMNNGWALFNTTPNGKNHAYDLSELAKNDPDWFYSSKSAYETNAIAETYRYMSKKAGNPVSWEECMAHQEEVLRKEKEEMDPIMYQQEYFCSFSAGAVGAYYADQMQWLRDNDRIVAVTYDPDLPVDTFWDIGMGDSTAIWFSQKIGSEVRVIDYYENNSKSFDFYMTELETRGYTYRTHWLPHDFNNKEFMIGKTRLQHAQERGWKNIKVVPRPSSKLEVIDMTRRVLKRCFFDKDKCKHGVKCLENYHREYDEVAKAFRKNPKHDWSSHASDAFSYLAMTYKVAPVDEPYGQTNPHRVINVDEIMFEGENPNRFCPF